VRQGGSWGRRGNEGGREGGMEGTSKSLISVQFMNAMPCLQKKESLVVVRLDDSLLDLRLVR
jgi:hypothetical protein